MVNGTLALCLACSLQMEWAHSCEFEHIAHLCWGPLPLPSWKKDQSSFHTILSESFHFNPCAFAASSGLQITSYFFNLCLSIFGSLLPHQISPCNINLLSLTLSEMASGESIAESLILPISEKSTRWAPQDPGDALWTGGNAECLILLSEFQSTH